MERRDPQARTRIENLPAEELTRVLGQLGHEVGTPLGSLLMMAEMLADSSAGDPGLQRRAERLKQAATEVRDLMHAFVRLVRLQTGWFSPRFAEVEGDAILRSIQAGASGLAESAEVAALTPLPAGQIDLDYLRDAVECCASWAASRGPHSLTVTPTSDVETGSVHCAFRCAGAAMPWHEPAILDPLGHGDLVTSRRHGGSGLQLALARVLVWRLGGELAGRFDEASGENVLDLVVPSHSIDPLGPLGPFGPLDPPATSS